MPSASGPVKITAGSWLILPFAAAALVFLRGYVWPTLSNVEVDVLRSLLDPALFARDFAVQDFHRFTPRFYFNFLVMLPTRAGLPLEWTFFLLHLGILAAWVSGVNAAARALGLGDWAAAVLTAWLLVVTAGSLGLVSLYAPAPLPAVWAGAAAAWGAAFGLRRQWMAAYASFAVAVLLQFLVGFYAGMLALPFLRRAPAAARIGALACWAAAMAAVFIPVWLDGSRQAAGLEREAFVTTYAYLRHPHHLVPTAWGWATWTQAAMFYLGAACYLHRTSAAAAPGERAVLTVTLGALASALALNYAGIELWPSATVAKLQPARLSPLAQAIVLGLLAIRVHRHLVDGRRADAILLAAIAFSPLPGLLLLLAAIVSPPPGRPAANGRTLLLAAAVLLAFQPFDPSTSVRALRYASWIAIVGSLVAAAWLARLQWRVVPAGVSVLAVAAICAVASATQRNDWPGILVQRLSLDARPVGGPAVLGARFRQSGPVDALVLAPPTSDAWAFKLHARRALVVDDKSAPFTADGLAEWRRRMDDVLGVPLAPGVDANAAWKARSPESIEATARRYGAEYVLTPDALQPRLPGQRVDQAEGWSLWKLP